MVSAYTQAGSDTTLRALELGAVDFIGKPKADGLRSMEDYADELVEKIRAAKSARLRRSVATSNVTSIRAASIKTSAATGWNGKIVFLGASTGGTEAIKEFLLGMPVDCPPVLIVQHMPEAFTASFAK